MSSNMSDPAVRTDLSIISTTVLWNIKSFSGMTQTTSAESCPFFLSNYILYLKFQKSTSCLYLYSFQDSMSVAVSDLHVEVCLIDPHGKSRFLCDREVSIRDGENMTQLMNVTESCTASTLSNDVLSIRCTVSIVAGQVELPGVGRILPEELDSTTTKKSTCLDTLSTDLEKFYNTGKDCDTVLRAADGVVYSTHRTVLSARSSALAGKFRPQSSEYQKEVIDIPNVPATILGDIIGYVYTGKVNGLTSDTATQMFGAALEYELPELKEICLEFIHNNVTVENVRDVALLAQELRNQELERKVELFVSENVVDVLKSTQWQEFTNQHHILANDILSNVLILSAKNIF